MKNWKLWKIILVLFTIVIFGCGFLINFRFARDFVISAASIALINWTLLVLFLFIIYVILVIIYDSVAIGKINKSFVGRGVTREGAESSFKAQNNKTKKLLMGLSKMDAILIPVNVVLAIATVAGLMHTVQISERINRPFISLDSSSIKLTEVAVNSKPPGLRGSARTTPVTVTLDSCVSCSKSLKTASSICAFTNTHWQKPVPSRKTRNLIFPEDR